MIIVTGATGKLGSAVVENLLQYVPAAQLAVSVREPDQALSLAARGINVRHGDFDQPETLVRSFSGADRLLLISASGIEYERRAARHRHAIDAARQARVGHIYYTSLLPGEASVAFVMKAHLDTEAQLKASGMPFTIFKNGVYAEAWDLYLGDLADGQVLIPADGPISWVSRLDLAAGIAHLLFEGGRAGATLNMTGPAAFDLRETTETLARFQRRALNFRIIPLDEYVDRVTASGKSVDFAWQWATTYSGISRREFGQIDPFLGTLLGHLRTVEDVLAAQHAEKH